MIKRDKAALDTILSAEGFCKAMAAARKKPASMATCQREMAEQNKRGLEAVTRGLPQGFEAGQAEVMPVAPEQGIYLVQVLPKGFVPKGPDAPFEGLMVVLAEADGRRFVFFTQKKKEPGPKK